MNYDTELYSIFSRASINYALCWNSAV